MVRISNLKDLNIMPPGIAREAMEAHALRCHDNDAEVMELMEAEFNGSLGGDWYLFEEGDNPRSFVFDEGDPADLLSDTWNWCDSTIREYGCFMIFWGTNNAGGPCLFVPDEPWIPEGLRAMLMDFVAEESENPCMQRQCA